MQLLKVILVLVFSAALFAKSGQSHNILALFPHHGYSHFKVYQPVLLALAARGHNVTVVTYISTPDPPSNFNEILLSGFDTVHSCSLDEFTTTRNLYDLYAEYIELHNEGQASCEHFFSSGVATDLLKKHRETAFDLVLVEYFNTDCYLALPYLLDLPVVAFSSCLLMPWNYDRILLPDTPSYVQSEFIGFPEMLNWRERFVNFVQAKFIKLAYRYYTNHHDNKLIQRYLNISMDVDAFAKSHTALIMVNQHYSLVGNRATTQQLVEIGGVHIREGQEGAPLSQSIEDFLGRSQNDVLFISWGSNIRASSLDAIRLKSIIQALEALPLNIVWKWEADTKPAASDKFLFVKWAPQLQLLCHPKIKYFWGHGGLLGLTESVHCAKPAIITPIYGDQFVNANAVRNRQIGLILSYNDITTETVRNAVEEIMLEKYSDKMKAVSAIFRQRQMAPVDLATWWIQHILEHKRVAKELLHIKAVQLNWIAYNSLDSVALLLALLVMALGSVRLLWALCWRRQRSSSATDRSPSNNNNNNKKIKSS